ncbi:hypothetical protein I8752_16315 [Nostocaceae cyanobacterium CENA369]|uniref:Uncharacterized protein n=1 Tax=Dendronalium phyllosphericum CENA369 TaxID=1725256 RepID=A0A8J7I233_9NOST|nr:hypothetical protein [Dendronalium phyllosphericum]MBH8574559.1 hypothetical protein [Dendronalium phyllosphericum CENA369]
MLHLSLSNIALPSIEARDFIAGTSLLISLFTAYWNIMRGAKFVSPPFRWIVFGRLPESHTLIINFPIAITNIGSRTGVIDAFYIEFTNLSTLKNERFYAWQESILIGQNFKGFGMEMPTPIALKSGESIVIYYVFFPDSLDFMYTCGLHKISLHAYINGCKKPIKFYEQKLDIDSVLEPSLLSDTISLLYSYKLIPTNILRVSNYGTEASATSIIQIAKK